MSKSTNPLLLPQMIPCPECKMINTILVVAGNCDQFLDYGRNLHITQKEFMDKYKYISSGDSLRGYNNDTTCVLFIGTWYEREDVNEIETVAGYLYKTQYVLR